MLFCCIWLGRAVSFSGKRGFCRGSATPTPRAYPPAQEDFVGVVRPLLPVPTPPMSRAVSFSCRGGAPVPAQRSETHTKSWTKRVGTGALPLQNDDLSENETALPP